MDQRICRASLNLYIKYIKAIAVDIRDDFFSLLGNLYYRRYEYKTCQYDMYWVSTDYKLHIGAEIDKVRDMPTVLKEIIPLGYNSICMSGFTLDNAVVFKPDGSIVQLKKHRYRPLDGIRIYGAITVIHVCC